MNHDHQKIWARVLGDLARQVRPELIGDWLANLELSECTPASVVVIAPNLLHAKLVEDHYAELLADGFEEVLGSRPQVQIRAQSAGGGSSEPATTEILPEQATYNPSFGLANFVEGSPNRLALAACRAVVDHPGELYNPLFIHGLSGTGKTHLLQALCSELCSSLRVLYLTADDFSSRMASSREESGGFREDFRSAQVIAMDDVQTLVGREASQEELFHAFNSLYNRNGQLIFASDQPPRKLTDLPERLTSRFTWGLTVEVEPPLFENRLEILASKAAARQLDLPPDVLEQLATPKISNVRELEGLLARLAAKLAIEGHQPARELARELASAAADETRPEVPLSSEKIQRLVANTYGLKPHDLLGPSRTHSVAIARHVAIYLAKQLTDLPIQEIGGHFGGRDHSTVNYAITKITRLIAEDEALAKTVTRLTKQLCEKRVIS
jgi:chromosomal replication initiator protein